MNNSAGFSFTKSIYRYEDGTDLEAEFYVDVSGCIYPGEKRSYESPGSDDCCEIHSVTHNGKDAQSLLSPEEIEEIEQEAFERHRESALAAQEAYCETLRDR